MPTTLFFLIIGAFGVLVFLNVYFRLKVLKHYKYLVRNEVQFGFKHFFDEQSMQKEILSRYPQHETEIRAFVKLIKKSVLYASFLLALIMLIGYLLMRNR